MALLALSTLVRCGLKSQETSLKCEPGSIAGRDKHGPADISPCPHFLQPALSDSDVRAPATQRRLTQRRPARSKSLKKSLKQWSPTWIFNTVPVDPTNNSKIQYKNELHFSILCAYFSVIFESFWDSDEKYIAQDDNRDAEDEEEKIL